MNVLIVEDEAPIARRIERFLKEIITASDLKIAKVNSISDGEEFISANKIDLLLLDLNLNGESGFTILQTMVSHAFHTIIVSAYQDKAIEAFDYGVLDFVLKPFGKQRLALALERFKSQKEKGPSALKFLAVKKAHTVKLIDISEVIYIKGAGIYTEIHLKDESKEIHDKSLDKLMQLLPDNFERIHKSYLVDMNNAVEYKVFSGSKYELILNNGHTLPIGRTRYKEVKEKWLN
ncbi:LytTR family DNA-binding domain-containing protein [Winogradskyella sp.]|uniref:LytR/AlgR family response regulator transcription factor n=1 Tax=Winogradskyella sp. TaxID=1883156 RepID=UPI002608967E|nr:LytTR family DNA-binding domain-containing protein [Winogradskyella sp.]